MRLAVLPGAALLMALAGCAASGSGPSTPTLGSSTATAEEAAAALAAREARLRALEDFSVAGGFGYWDDTQNLTARIEWRERDASTDILLVAPLGLGRLRLNETPAGATLERGDGAPRTGPDAGALLQRELGLAAPIPLAAVRDWIRGLEGKGARDVRRNAAGRIESLRFVDASGNRWRASMRRYADVDGLELPSLLTATSGGRHLRLALSDWRVDHEATDVPAAVGSDPGIDPASSGGRLAIPGR